VGYHFGPILATINKKTGPISEAGLILSMLPYALTADGSPRGSGEARL